MNLIKLKEYNDSRIVYDYQPEGKGEWGEIVYLFADDSVSITKKASDSSPTYDHHALKQVKEFVKRKELPREITQAWH